MQYSWKTQVPLIPKIGLCAINGTGVAVSYIPDEGKILVCAAESLKLKNFFFFYLDAEPVQDFFLMKISYFVMCLSFWPISHKSIANVR